MTKPVKNKPTEDDLIAAILRVKPTADMPKYPKRKAKATAKKKKA